MKNPAKSNKKEKDYSHMIGNQWWRLRSKHGRDYLFESPEALWEAACEYFQWCIDNPLIETDFRGKDAEKVSLPHPRPFTIQGLTRYLDCNVSYFNEFRKSLEGKDDQKSKDFSQVATRILETIYDQKFTGAATGFYSATIIARDLGLKEQSEITNPDGNLKTNIALTIDQLFPDPNKDDGNP